MPSCPEKEKEKEKVRAKEKAKAKVRPKEKGRVKENGVEMMDTNQMAHSGVPLTIVLPGPGAEEEDAGRARDAAKEREADGAGAVAWTRPGVHLVDEKEEENETRRGFATTSETGCNAHGARTASILMTFRGSMRMEG